MKKMNLNISSINELLRIHFILKTDVMEFIKKLTKRIRKIKTSTDKTNRNFRNEVRGRVNWQDTIKERCKHNYADETLFVWEETDKDFNIKENLVLKKIVDGNL